MGGSILLLNSVFATIDINVVTRFLEMVQISEDGSSGRTDRFDHVVDRGSFPQQSGDLLMAPTDRFVASHIFQEGLRRQFLFCMIPKPSFGQRKFQCPYDGLRL